MKIEDVKKCSFQNWYYNFEKVTVKSIILSLPREVALYILEDGVVLPQNINSPFQVDPNSSDDSDSEVDWEDTDTQEAESPQFPEFDKQIEDAIDDLGGKVFPKLNWSSPQDASWIAQNASLSCSSPYDIYLLLKSSSIITHDLTKAFSDCEDYVPDENVISSLCQPSEQFYLVLRRWMDIDTSGEFRCFVKDNNLIGICQREISVYFDHIGANRGSIIEDILTFFKKNIQSTFPSLNYVFDVYRKKEKCVKLLDFNPFGKVTDALLYTWEELDEQEVEDGLPEFRYVAESQGVRPRPLSYHGIPKDIVDICTGEDSSKLVDFIKLQIQEQENWSSSSDDDDDIAEK